MKVDFWQLSSDPVEKVVALISKRVIASGERLLVVCDDAQKREVISNALWAAGPDNFLANGESRDIGAERQPILLSDTLEPANAASHVIFADGEYRDPAGFVRAFLLFGEETLDAARATWKSLDTVEGLDRAFFRQDGGKWVKMG